MLVLIIPDQDEKFCSYSVVSESIPSMSSSVSSVVSGSVPSVSSVAIEDAHWIS